MFSRARAFSVPQAVLVAWQLESAAAASSIPHEAQSRRSERPYEYVIWLLSPGECVRMSTARESPTEGS